MAEQGLTLVAGIADPREPDVGVRAALELARRHGTALHLVHALPPVGGAVPTPCGEREGRVLGAYAAYIGSLARPHLALDSEGDVRFHARVGSPDHAILSVCSEVSADLVLVGAAPHHRPGSRRLGTTARRLMRRAEQPVLVVRVSRPGARRVLIATDLSSAAVAITNLGIQVVETLTDGPRPDIRALLVIPDATVPAPLPEDTLLRAAIAQLQEFLDDFSVPMRPAVRTGEAAEQVLAEAAGWGADLVVLGTHGRRGMARIRQGSVAELVLSALPCNALVIPPRMVGPYLTVRPTGTAAMLPRV